MDKQNGIYGYWDKEKNQMVYIGQSNDIFRRHSHHTSPSCYNEQQINRVIQNNPERYELVIIKARPTFSKEDRDILEKHYIKIYNTFSDKSKFNYTPGGDFAPSTLLEVRKKISKKKRGENNHMYGKHHTKESIEKMREAKLGKYNGSNHPFYGKKHTEEAKRKISVSRNTTGYFRVSMKSRPDCKSGKIYRYVYYDDGKQKEISSVKLEKLKEKVLRAGLPWEKIN